MANRLAQSTSPYLLQHQDNPVDWWEWGEPALAAAQADDRPILLSVGYAACHWCHVMAHESFEDGRIAEVMNATFINVKVDREERPDVDQLYQHALALLGEQGGWPLTMFLTPTGEPFWGGTYFPPTPRFGRPSLEQVLTTIDRLWHDERHRVLSNRDSLKDALGRLATVEAPVALPADVPRQVAERLLTIVDREHGGFGDAPKFPQVPMLDLLWREGLAADNGSMQEPVIDALDRMAVGGLWDHVGGGFVRYSVDRYWHVPHFEKMLYDNAQLLALYAEAAARTGRPLFARRAEGLVSWLEREMRTPQGFAASLDADSEGVEGRFYVWSRREIDAALGADAAAFAAIFDVREEGNWEDTNVVHRLGDKDRSAEHEMRLQPWLDRLRTVREQRVRPAQDGKILADWNGMMIGALAQAGLWLDRQDWIDLAAAVFRDVLTALGPEDRLAHSFHGGRRLDVGFLDDHAQLARAAALLFTATGDDAYLARATALLAAADDRFRQDNGTYAPGPAEGLLPIRSRWMVDGPTPSPLGTLAQARALLFHVTGEAGHAAAASSLLRAYGGEVGRNPAAYASLLSARRWLETTVVAKLVGPEGQRAPLRQALRRSAPACLLDLSAAGEQLALGHPLATSGSGSEAAVVLCSGGTCSRPLTSTEAIAEELARRAKS